MAAVAGVAVLARRKIAVSVRSQRLGRPWVHRIGDHQAGSLDRRSSASAAVYGR
jgi:hypothetical protein